MNCKCYKEDDRPLRDKFRDEKQETTLSTNAQKQKAKKTAPLGMKVLNALGLRQYILNKFVFKKQPAKYEFKLTNSQINSHQKFLKLNRDRQIQQIQGYQIICELLQEQQNSIPIVWVRLKSTLWYQKPTVIYSHGNSSDISQAYGFISQLSKTLRVNYVIYDYTGYGISNKTYTTQQSICKDLQLVVKWLNIQYKDIVLWGFSLGTFPTVACAANHKFGRVILQSPIASAACFFDENALKQEQMNSGIHYTYDMDCLDNLKNIGLISSQIVIIHSLDDEIIPIDHGIKLYQIIKSQNKAQKSSFIQVQKLKHNQMHYFFTQNKINPLNKFLREYIGELVNKMAIKRFEKKKSNQQQKTFRNFLMNQLYNMSRQSNKNSTRNSQKVKQNNRISNQQDWDFKRSKQKQKFYQNQQTRKHKFYFHAKQMEKDLARKQ